MKEHPLAEAMLYNHLYAAVARLVGRFTEVFEPSGGVPEGDIRDVADWYHGHLTIRAANWGEGERAAREAVTVLVDPPDTDWWGGPIGRAVAWWIGYTEDVVPQPVVAAVLGISRQRVSGLTRDARGAGATRGGGLGGGLLKRAPGTTGIERGSLVAYMRHRWPAGEVAGE